MTALVRETYYRGLWALLQGVVTSPAIATYDRRLRAMERMGDGELPALFMVVGKQVTERKSALPVRRLGAEIFLIVANPDTKTASDIALNGMIDAVEAALDPGALALQTLGGLVSHCWIEGDTEIFSAPNGTRAAAIVPVMMEVP